MNEAKYVRSEFIRLKTFLCLVLSDLGRVGKGEIDAYAYSEMLALILKTDIVNYKQWNYQNIY
jgi:hypothetical protein